MRHRRWVPALVAIVVGVIVTIALRGRWPDPGEVVDALSRADTSWIAAAVLLQQMSLWAFAAQQHTLLSALGIRMTWRDAVAITYTRHAISLSVPAGPAVSAAFAIKQFRQRGATITTSATCLALVGVTGTAGLLVLYTASHGALTAIVILVTLGIAALVCRRLGKTFTTIRVRDAAAALALAVLQWLLDVACLVAAARACDLPLTIAEMTVAFLAVQVARQIPLTPGGLGVIEASLLAALATAGAPQAAAAAVLVYRLASFWLMLPAGLIAYLTVRQQPQRVSSPTFPAEELPSVT